jgi:hypothetical protein
MGKRVSVGQAAANALAKWLETQLENVSVYPRWPEPNVRLSRAVTVAVVGRRQRLNVVTGFDLQTRQNLTATTALVGVRIGSFIQPIQLDAWATYDVDRDDIVDQLDDALTASAVATGVAQTDDPVRDGILLPLLEDDGFTGTVEFWFDEPDVDNTPDSVQRSEFRATYFGEARGDFTRVRVVPRMVNPSLHVLVSESNPPPAGQLYDTSTLSSNGATPPVITVTRGTATD